MNYENGYCLEYTGTSDLARLDIISTGGKRVRLKVRRQKRYSGLRVIFVADLLAARGLLNSPSNRYRKYTGPIDIRWAEGSFVDSIEGWDDIISSAERLRDSGEMTSADWDEIISNARESKNDEYPPAPEKEKEEEAVPDDENGPGSALVAAVEAYMAEKDKIPQPGPFSKQLGRKITKSMIDSALEVIQGG